VHRLQPVAGQKNAPATAAGNALFDNFIGDELALSCNPFV
jgi:hypothetical protein